MSRLLVAPQLQMPQYGVEEAFALMVGVEERWRGGLMCARRLVKSNDERETGRARGRPECFGGECLHGGELRR